LHYELYRNGRAVNPASVKFTQKAQLGGSDLAQFKSTLRRLKSVKAGAALAPLRSSTQAQDSPQREIDRLTLRVGQSRTDG
jgi:hypothetical protein